MSQPSVEAEIAARYHEGLYRYALALCRRDRQEASEIVQQVYLEILEGRVDLMSARDQRNFLFGVARKIAAARWRRRSIFSRIMALKHEPDQGTRAFQNPEEETCQGERTRKTRTALGELPSRQLQVITLVFAEGLTVEEAAFAMGVSIGSARTHYHRAKARLANLLEGVI